MIVSLYINISITVPHATDTAGSASRTAPGHLNYCSNNLLEDPMTVKTSTTPRVCE